MAERERVLNKVRDYCLTKLGFMETEHAVLKVLSDKKDFVITDKQIMDILSGKAFGGHAEMIYDVIEENYITSRIIEKYQDEVSFTEKERIWLNTREDMSLGTDEVEDYIWELCQVITDHKAVDNYVAKVKKNNERKAA